MSLTTVGSGPHGRRVTLPQRYARTSLHAVHHQIEHWFQQFPSASPSGQLQLALRICSALRASTRLAEEIQYPSFLQSGLHGRLQACHPGEYVGTRQLIEEIEQWPPGDTGLATRVDLLAQMFGRYMYSLNSEYFESIPGDPEEEDFTEDRIGNDHHGDHLPPNNPAPDQKSA
jgi:hypothetical protein